MNERPAFDVVVVPDFSAPARSGLFEVRTLFFLGAWLENAGAARAFPLHIACIGEPPRSVRDLAARCDARVCVRDPMPEAPGGNLHKLRGFTIPAESPRILLLDTDVFVLRDFSALAREIPDGIAAAPAGIKWIAGAHWRRIYEGLGLPYPAELGQSLYYELGLIPEGDAIQRQHGVVGDLRAMPPYHNTGVVLADRDCGLPALWADHHRRIREFFLEPAVRRSSDDSLATWLWRRGRRWVGSRRKAPHTVTTCDQAAFATAVQSLRATGVPFRRLPERYHARLAHCQAGAIGWEEMRLFHATGFLRGWSGNRGDLAAHLEAYVTLWTAAFRAGAHRRDRPETVGRDMSEVANRLRGLHRRYVVPALEGAAP